MSTHRGLGWLLPVLLLLLGLLTAPTAWAGWLPPVTISEGSENGGPPRVVLDSGGNATAVWTRWSGNDTVVESAFRPAGGSWEAPVDLSEPEAQGGAAGAHDAQSPQIAVDGAGDVTVVWERYAESKMLIQADYRPAGGSWQPFETIGEMPLASAPEPWIAVDKAGDATAIWKAHETIQSAYKPAGGNWEAPVAVSGSESFTPQAAVDAKGDTTVVWMHFNGSEYVVQSAYRPAGGSWEAPTLVSEPGEHGGDPYIALDAKGDTLVVWRSASETTEAVRAAFRPSGGSWEAPATLSIPGHGVEELRTALAPSGDAVTVWSDYTKEVGGYSTVDAAFRPAGGNWEAPVELSQGGANAFPSDVVFDSSGNAAVIWERSDGTSNMVQAAYRPVDEEWEAPTALSEEGEQGVDPVIVLDAPGDATAADGDATAIWMSGGAIEAAGYDPSGLPAIELDVPETGQVGTPVEVSGSVEGESLWSPVLEFGDGESAAAAEATHTYEQPGEYEVKLEGAEELGYRSGVMRKIDIVAPGGSPGGESGGSTPPQGTTPPPPEQQVTTTTQPSSPSPSSECEAARAAHGDALRRFRLARGRLRQAREGAEVKRLRGRTHRLLAALRRARRSQHAACTKP